VLTMRISTKAISFQLKRTRPFVALFAVAILLGGTFSNSMVSFADGMKDSKAKKLTENQRIVHILNRLGFGARPGDVERVKAMGVENYINQQLNPDKIADSVAESKVKDLGVLNMSTAELYEKFPQPGQLLRQLQARGVLPSDLAEARDNRVKGGANAAPLPGQMPAGEMQGDPAKGNQPQQPPPGNPVDNEKYRAALQEYYRQNGLQQPQRIMAELQASRIIRAVYSERQLQEVMVDFWTNHFNVFAGKGADRWLLPSYDRDTIRPNAMAKFSTLLEATAESPAMLFYLDNFQSVTPNPQRNAGQGQRRPGLLAELVNLQRRRDGNPMAQPANRQPPVQQRRGINENYARELMELHTLGVDGGYTQKDVQEVARCFTGWTIFAPRGGALAGAGMMREAGRQNPGTFFFNERAHDDGEKVVLGQKISAGGGIKDGLMVLDILSRHPSTAKFIATKLVRHFVSDEPPASLVAKVATTYQKTDGDIREMLKTIFFSPEFNAPEAYRAKIKRPFELAVSAVRALGADTNGGPQFHQWIARMGQPLYGFQTPNGYSDTAEAWVNTGALLERLNFGLSLASNRIPGTRVDLTKIAVATDGGQASDKTQVMERYLKALMAGDVSPKTKETLISQINEQAVASAQQSPRDVSADQVTKLVGLILGSPEFQRQ
jgi:uncharacterized protein (DUF1800 family)